MDYLAEVRNNLQAAQARKDAERAEEARATRWAKIVVVSMLLIVAAFVVMFGDNVANWS